MFISQLFILGTTALTFAASPYDACVQRLGEEVARSTGLAIQKVELKDYGHSTYLEYILSKISGGWKKPDKWEKPGKPTAKGWSNHNFQFAATTDQTELSYRFQAKLREVRRSEFGSGKAVDSLECCIIEDSVAVTDKGSGFKKSFRASSSCDSSEFSTLSKPEVISSKELKTGLCKEFGKTIISWSTSNDWTSESDNKTPAPCHDGERQSGNWTCHYNNSSSTDYRTLKQHKGCKLAEGNVDTGSENEESLPFLN